MHAETAQPRPPSPDMIAGVPPSSSPLALGELVASLGEDFFDADIEATNGSKLGAPNRKIMPFAKANGLQRLQTACYGDQTRLVKSRLPAHPGHV
ncbi:MAG: hypothetical protein HKL96_08450 [Phycisphaerales bacterium]|nr:hypothetical protein [Phycisphaerales bacterium]